MQGVRALVVCLIALWATAGCGSNTPTAPGPPAGDQPPPSSNPASPAPADPSPPPDSPPPPADPSAPPDSPIPPPNQAPSITSHPKSQTVSAGTGVTLTVKATGPGSLAYRWFAGSSGQTSSPIAGARDDRYTTPALTKTTRFWVRVSNAGGSSDSDTATISVDAPAEPQPAAPQITSQPKDRTVTSGQSATLTVSATGTGPLTVPVVRRSARGYLVSRQRCDSVELHDTAAEENDALLGPRIKRRRSGRLRRGDDHRLPPRRAIAVSKRPCWIW